jgi:hypothetical protein
LMAPNKKITEGKTDWEQPTVNQSTGRSTPDRFAPKASRGRYENPEDGHGPAS